MPSGSRSAQVAPPTTRRRAMGRQGYRGSRVRMPMASPNWSMVDIAYSTWNRRPAPGRVLHELDTAAQGPQATQPHGGYNSRVRTFWRENRRARVIAPRLPTRRAHVRVWAGR